MRSLHSSCVKHSYYRGCSSSALMKRAAEMFATLSSLGLNIFTEALPWSGWPSGFACYFDLN